MSISTKEQENSIKVFDLLLKIKDISFKRVDGREDLFIVTEPETDLDILIDVEDDTVILGADIGNVYTDGKISANLAEYLLMQNNNAIHGTFAIAKQHLYLKCVLQAENLDLNELESAIQSMIYTLATTIEGISTRLEIQSKMEL